MEIPDNSPTSCSISTGDARPSATTASAMFSIVSGVISLTSPTIPAGWTTFTCRQARSDVRISAFPPHRLGVELHVSP